MTVYHPVPTKHFVTGPDHQSEHSRITRGTKVEAQAAGTFVQQNAELKDAAANLNTQTGSLSDLLDSYNKADAAFKLARTALGSGVIAWDTCYGVYTSVASKYVKTEQDAAACGLTPRGYVNYGCQAPISVDLVYRPKKDELFVHVHRPKGMRGVSTEISTDPSNPASWKELDGDGATHVISHPAPGTYTVRAACKTSQAKSDYTLSATLTVK